MSRIFEVQTHASELGETGSNQLLGGLALAGSHNLVGKKYFKTKAL